MSKEGIAVEKLAVVIEFTAEELEAFNSFIEQNCLDIGKYLKRLIENAEQKRAAQKRASQKWASVNKKIAQKEGAQ